MELPQYMTRQFYRGIITAVAITTLTGCPSREYTPREQQIREERHQKEMDSLEREVRAQMDRMERNQNFGGQQRP